MYSWRQKLLRWECKLGNNDTLDAQSEPALFCLDLLKSNVVSVLREPYQVPNIFILSRMADQPQKQFFFFYVPYLPEKVFTAERIADFKEHVDRVSGLRKSGFISCVFPITRHHTISL